MILLELENKIIADTLTYKFENAKFTSIDITVADFDGVLYKIFNPDGDKSKVVVAISLSFYADLQRYGADDYLKKEYGDFFTAPPDNFDVALKFDLENIPENYQEVIKKASLLKRNCFAGVFDKFFDFQIYKLTRICSDLIPTRAHKT